MSWEHIEQVQASSEDRKRQANKAREDMEALLKCYSRCFATDDGQKVLQDLSKRFIMGNDTPFDAANIEYQAAYHNGETGVVKFVIDQLNRASKIVQV